MEGPEQRAQHLEVMAAEGMFATLVRPHTAWGQIHPLAYGTSSQRF